MPRDFEDAINLDQLDDEEIRDLLRQRLHEDDDFDVESVEIEVRDGRIQVEGRVGTEEERQRVDHVLTGLGAEEWENNVVVDDLARAGRSEAADVARLEDAAVSDELGERANSTTDEAEHLRPDVAGEQYGTHDLKKAVEQGQSYAPPDGPVQEGAGGGERH